MNNEYSKDYDGLDRLTLNFDGSMSVDVSVDIGGIHIFSSYDSIEIDCNSIPIEDWEQVKEFVDNQIKLLDKGV